MKSFKKVLLFTFALSLLLNVISLSKVDKLKIFNIEYTRDGNKVRYAIKYDNVSVEHDLQDESNINSFYFKFVWEYNSLEEKNKGQSMIADIKNDFDTAIEEDNRISIIFKAKDLSNLKLYKKNEFGSSFVLELDQKGKKVQLQLQIPKDQPFQDEFHDLIVKVLEAKKPCKFLSEIIIPEKAEKLVLLIE